MLTTCIGSKVSGYTTADLHHLINKIASWDCHVINRDVVVMDNLLILWQICISPTTLPMQVSNTVASIYNQAGFIDTKL